MEKSENADAALGTGNHVQGLGTFAEQIEPGIETFRRKFDTPLIELRKEVSKKHSAN